MKMQNVEQPSLLGSIIAMGNSTMPTMVSKLIKSSKMWHMGSFGWTWLMYGNQAWSWWFPSQTKHLLQHVLEVKILQTWDSLVSNAHPTWLHVFINGLFETWSIGWGDTPCPFRDNQPRTFVPSWGYLSSMLATWLS
jgi:hypothetical protein